LILELQTSPSTLDEPAAGRRRSMTWNVGEYLYIEVHSWWKQEFH
jgi:hypothetical protein